MTGQTSDRPATKILTGLALGVVALGALVLSPVTLFTFLLALMLVAAGELFRIARGLGVTPLPLVGFAAIVAVAVLAYRGPDTLLSGVPGVAAATAGVSFIVLIARSRLQGALAGVAATVAATLYVGLLGSFIIAMRRGPDGFRVVLVFGLMVTLNDAFAYFAGRGLGRHPMAPSVSPSKTWEGLAGGTAASFAVAAVAAWQLDPPFTSARAMLLAALVSITAPLGDLAESALKRDAGVKDSAGSWGGHGGLLDRLDGVLFAAPVFYFAYRAMVR